MPEMYELPQAQSDYGHDLELENGRLREALKEAEEYFDQRADAEYLPGQAAPTGNEEMTLLCLIRAALSGSAP